MALLNTLLNTATTSHVSHAHFAPFEFQVVRRSAEIERPATAQAVDRLLQNMQMTPDAVSPEFSPAVSAQNLKGMASEVFARKYFPKWSRVS